MSLNKKDLSIKTLMGPGPTNLHKRVRDALSKETISHLDPEFFDVLNSISSLLRIVFQTNNKVTFAVSGTGSSGMEMTMANVIEEKDKILILKCGEFGNRMSDSASRYGANVTEMEIAWGESFNQLKVIEKIKTIKNLKAVALVHAETSTGVLQDIELIGEYLKNTDILFIVDAVTSLAGVQLKVDEWGVDICYSGTQKCLSVPPGLSPITFSEKSLSIIKKRKNKVSSWYFDLSLLVNYWGEDRVYHHTAPVNMLFALNEGLKLCCEEGLANRFARHADNGEHFDIRLKELGLASFVNLDKYKALPMLKSVIIPDGIADLQLRKDLLLNEMIEIGGGLGPTKGKIWRIGIMGFNSEKALIDKFFNKFKLYLNQ